MIEAMCGLRRVIRGAGALCLRVLGISQLAWLHLFFAKQTTPRSQDATDAAASPSLRRSFRRNLLSFWALVIFHFVTILLARQLPLLALSSGPKRASWLLIWLPPYVTERFPAGLGFAGLVVLEEALMQWALPALSSPLGSGILEPRGTGNAPTSSPGCSPSLLVRSSQGLLQHRPGRVTNGT